MRTEAFDYILPASLIAQYPSPERGGSRLMVLHRSRGTIEHREFRDLPSYLAPGDLLVMNDTRVLPVRLVGKKETGGRAEVLLIPSVNGISGEWEVLVKGSGRLKRGTRIEFGQGLSGRIEEIREGKGRISFDRQQDIGEILRQIGRIPLPPYIKREDEPLDRDRYQTVYAEREGAIAAPTAGLHFTHDLLRTLRTQGVGTSSITLHIGIGTFAPVKADEVEDHRVGTERVEIPVETADAMERTRARQGKVIAVGTTTTRSLESFPDGKGGVRPCQGTTSLFIYPPFRFRVIDGMITNFHLPKSSLVMMVSAFAGREFLMRAYQEAVEREYRFYSYGDAMLIL